MKTRIFRVAATVFVLLLCLAGCKKSDQGAAGNGKVEEVWMYSSIGSYQTFLEQQVMEWNETEGALKG